MNLVLIETSGNQQYIFSTNKLRENVGASELTYRAGTQFVLEAVAAAGGPTLWTEDARQLRADLLSQAKIEDQQTKLPVEVIVAASGKAVLLVNDRETGQKIIRQVTMTALEEAPGLDVCGVISEHFEWTEKLLAVVNREVHEKFEGVHANLPGPTTRFLRLPIAEDCATSGLPAAQLDKRDKNDSGPRSAVSWQKRGYRQAYERRMQTLPGLKEARITFAKNIGTMEEASEWLAVIHADGNGLGEIFLNLGQYAGCLQPNQNRKYVEQYRRLSLALDICTENAFVKALNEMLTRDSDAWFKLPILPIVLGGDDLTIVCDGRAALQFTHDFLTEFERQTTRKDLELVGDIIPTIVLDVFKPANRLSTSAGVAIVKPHFPFSAAYDLAEELIKSAKEVKKVIVHPDKEKNGRSVPWPCSAIDFHALYDSTATSLDEIRRKLTIGTSKTRIYGRPYVVTPQTELVGAQVGGPEWAAKHHWEKLQEKVEKIREHDDGRRKIPNSQLHDLRAGLHLGQEVADARFDLIRQRYPIAVLAESDKSLFREETVEEDGKNREVLVSSLLDAMDAANFW